MRSLLNIITESREPFIDAHRSGNSIEIEMMWLPDDQRGQGKGREYYLKWEASLPDDIQYVKLWAADTGTGKTNQFWEAMGFDYMYTSGPGGPDNDEDDHWWWMIKGVNGTPTPEPKVVTNDDDDSRF